MTKEEAYELESEDEVSIVPKIKQSINKRKA